LSAPESSQGKEETAAITAIGTAPNSLAQRVLALSKANPKDPRLAEMLHLVVTTTRYGNTDDKTTAYSKQAFQSLHKNFPGSEWTKKTKFWF
jgi:TolA-binding protein